MFLYFDTDGQKIFIDLSLVRLIESDDEDCDTTIIWSDGETDSLSLSIDEKDRLISDLVIFKKKLYGIPEA